MIRIHASNNINTSRHGSNSNKPFEPLSTSIDLEQTSRNVNDWINAGSYVCFDLPFNFTEFIFC